MDTPDYHYSSLSELESLSDSDWLDISSRGDDDSLLASDSDPDDPEQSRPVSRRSFTSAASSHGQVVEGWEGLIDDSADETPSADRDAADVFAHVVPAEGGHSPKATSSPVPEEADSDDERVKAALDQSMISTLNSPRSSPLSSSMQTSIVHSTRSLRLSFPDPTTSKLPSLHTSFEELSQADLDADVSSADPAVVEATRPPAADSDHLSTSDIPATEDTQSGVLDRNSFSALKVDFHVVLYGSSSAAQFTLVEMLLDKWAASGDLIRGQKYIYTANTVMHEYECFTLGAKSAKRLISVTDRTGEDDVSGLPATLSSNSDDPQPGARLELDAPSLAVVFLPNLEAITLPEHTVYLPVLMTSSLSADTDCLLEAEQQWEAQAIPSAQLTSFSTHASPVVEQETLEQATPQQVAHAFRPLLPASAKNAVIPKVSPNALTMCVCFHVVDWISILTFDDTV